jgi:hypothetical protein
MLLCMQWREVDYEWLGSRPDEVATSIFKNGKNVPNDIKHKLSDVSTAAPPGIQAAGHSASGI